MRKELPPEKRIKHIAAVIATAEVVNGKWTLPVLMTLMDRNKRYSEIVAEIKGISDMSLARELKELERAGLIVRILYTAMPPLTEYSVTDRGLSLRSILREFHQWAEVYKDISK